MSDINFYYNLKMRARRHPALHRPLKKIRRLAEKFPVLLINLLRAFSSENHPRLGPPKGSFSIYQSLRHENRRPGRVVLTDQGAPTTTPGSLQIVSGLNQHACQPWPVFWSRHQNARLVTPSLALLDERKRLCRESVYGDICLGDDPAWLYPWLPKPILLAGNWTSIVSRWAPNDGVPMFTHWILDALPRLALLPEFPPDTKILVPSKLAGYQKETLQLLGLTGRCRLSPERHLILENYYFSSPTAMLDCYNPFGVNFLREKFLPLADKNYSGPKKFLIHRSNKSRGIINEAEVYEFFRKSGWEIVDTEKLTFAQEIKLFNDAEAISGVFGSGFTNAVWCRPGCKLLPFVADCWLDGYVEWIAEVVGAEFHYRIFPSDHAMRAQVNLETVAEMLRATGLHPK
jgi:hypothetical protein